ncbi:unnamed protein product, partial [Allacma fusca]
NSTQVERFQEDSLFNYGLTMTQLLCEPPENFNLLNFAKESTVEDGYGECISSLNANTELPVCWKQSLGRKNLFEVSFHDTVRTLHQCYIPPIKKCSQGNTTKELHLLVSNGIELRCAEGAPIDMDNTAPVKFQKQIIRD